MASYRITEEIHRDAARLHARPSSLRRGIQAAIIAVVVAGSLLSSDALKPVFIGGAVAGLAVVLVARLLSPWLLRRQYDSYKALQENVSVELVDSGLSFASLHGAGQLPWPHIFKWREDAHYLLIYQARRLYHIVPKSLGTAGLDIEALRAELMRRVGPAR